METAIAEGLAALGMGIAQAGRLAQFLELLQRWNGAYNLTAIRDIDDMVLRHVIDSLAVMPFVSGPRVLDAGTGAGFPGVPIAMIEPDWHVVLVDASAKKTRFLTQAAADLGIDNVSVIRGRLETYRGEAAFDTVVARALTSLDGFIGLAGHLTGPDGRLVAMKGRMPAEELSAIRDGWQAESSAVDVPGLDAERHVVVINKVNPGATAA